MNYVKDIDTILFKMWLFYRFDVLGVNVSREEAKQQKIKTFFILSCLTLSIVRHIIYLFVIENSRLGHHYFDILQYLGGVPEIIYICVITLSCFSLIVILLINNVNNYQWFDIFKVLSGSQPIGLIELYDHNTFVILAKRSKLVMFIIKTYLKNIFVFSIFFNTFCVLIGYHMFDELLYGVLAVVAYYSVAAPIVIVTAYSFAFFYIVTFYCRLRFQMYHTRLLTFMKKGIH